jgi:hypothetical protein
LGLLGKQEILVQLEPPGCREKSAPLGPPVKQDQPGKQEILDLQVRLGLLENKARRDPQAQQAQLEILEILDQLDLKGIRDQQDPKVTSVLKVDIM